MINGPEEAADAHKWSQQQQHPGPGSVSMRLDPDVKTASPLRVDRDEQHATGLEETAGTTTSPSPDQQLPSFGSRVHPMSSKESTGRGTTMLKSAFNAVRSLTSYLPRGAASEVPAFRGRSTSPRAVSQPVAPSAFQPGTPFSTFPAARVIFDEQASTCTRGAGGRESSQQFTGVGLTASGVLTDGQQEVSEAFPKAAVMPETPMPMQPPAHMTMPPEHFAPKSEYKKFGVFDHMHSNVVPRMFFSTSCFTMRKPFWQGITDEVQQRHFGREAGTRQRRGPFSAAWSRPSCSEKEC